jgi:hypothetical protein
MVPNYGVVTMRVFPVFPSVARFKGALIMGSGGDKATRSTPRIVEKQRSSHGYANGVRLILPATAETFLEALRGWRRKCAHRDAAPMSRDGPRIRGAVVSFVGAIANKGDGTAPLPDHLGPTRKLETKIVYDS